MIKSGNCPSTSSINNGSTTPFKPKDVVNQKHYNARHKAKKQSSSGIMEAVRNATSAVYCTNRDSIQQRRNEQAIFDHMQQQSQCGFKKVEQKQQKSDKKELLTAIIRAYNSAPDGFSTLSTASKAHHSPTVLNRHRPENGDSCETDYGSPQKCLHCNILGSREASSIIQNRKSRAGSPCRCANSNAGNRRMMDKNGRPTVRYNSITTISSASMTDSDSVKSPVSSSNPLDHQLMDITLKNVKYMRGSSKFTVFGDFAFQREFLEAHNILRKRHNVPELIWCQDLANEAAEWAHLVAEKGRILYRERGPDVGENIALIQTRTADHLPTGKEIVDLWTKQAEKFDFENPKWTAECQNFTQLTWKSTIRLGACRIWLQSKNLVAVVAFYSPRGNKNGIGEFSKNILPPKIRYHRGSTTVITSDYGSSSEHGALIASNFNANLNLHK